jgi:hypothetical protein
VLVFSWASPGWEDRGEFKNFEAWLECAKEESREWKEFDGS